jgi:putative transposase
MPEAIELLIHFVVSSIKLLKPGGVKVVMAETIAMKKQLIVMNRGKKRSPKYLCSDNDPLYLFHRWQANLRLLEIDEVKSVPGNPTSHPFVERVIGTTRREYLDHTVCFNGRDLQNKLDKFQACYNDVRAHSSLDMKTPTAMAFGVEPDEKVVSIDHRRWKKHCNGLYELPVAA